MLTDKELEMIRQKHWDCHAQKKVDKHGAGIQTCAEIILLLNEIERLKKGMEHVL